MLCALVLLCAGAERAIDACFGAFDADRSGALDRAELGRLVDATLVRARALLEELLGAFVGDEFDELAADYVCLVRICVVLVTARLLRRFVLNLVLTLVLT